MRKTKFGLMALCSMMALTACGGSETGSTPAPSKTEDSVPEKVTITFEQYDLIVGEKKNKKTLRIGDNLFATYQLKFDYGYVVTDDDLARFFMRDYMNFKMPSEEVKEKGGVLSWFYLEKGMPIDEAKPFEAGTELIQDMTIYFSFVSKSQWRNETVSEDTAEMVQSMPVVHNRKAVDNLSESSEEETVTITFEQYGCYSDAVRDADGGCFYANTYLNDTFLTDFEMTYPVGHVLTEEDIKEQEKVIDRQTIHNGSGYYDVSSAYLSKEGCMCYLKEAITAGMKLDKSFTAYVFAN